MASTAKPVRPPVAIEIAVDRVVGARASQTRTSVEVFSARPLAAGVVVPSLQDQNIHDRPALAQALAAVLESVGPRGRDVTLVVPDASARVMLMDFDTFPDHHEDALSLIRFRLKKLLPFDADRAAISYQASRNGTFHVVTAVAASSVLEEYESVIRDAGINPGVVLPSLAASLGLVDASQPTLLIKADSGTISVAIADRGELRLARTLDGRPPDTAEQLADDVHPMLVFFEDTFGSRIQRVVVAGSLRAEALGSALAAQTGARVEDLVPSSVAGSGSQLPPGALAGVAGAVLEL
jgi:type IV pilus assembly protein PilM